MTAKYFSINQILNICLGLLQKGDGSILDFKSYPKLAEVVMGNKGQKRPVECSKLECDGAIGRVSPFLNVISLTHGPDGSVYVGDYNLIRKLTNDGKLYTILQFGYVKNTVANNVS